MSVKYTHLASQGVNYVYGPDQRAPMITIHRFSWKNTGTANLKNILLEFAPDGGDSAYNENIKQSLFVERPLQSPDLGRTGVGVTRKGNSVLIKYQRFPTGVTDTITIVSPGVVETYTVTASDPDIKLKVNEVETDFKNPMIERLTKPPLGWKQLLLGMFFSSSMTGAILWLLLRRRKKSRE